MRILHFLWGLPNGGAENLAVDLANEQSRDNEVVLLVANSMVDDSVRARVEKEVHFVGLGRPEGSRNPYWAMRILRSLQTLRPDVVHSHDVGLSTFRQLITPPMILTVHTTDVQIPTGVTKFNMVCCISRSVFLDVKRRYPRLNVRQVDNGIPMSRITVRCQSHPSWVRVVQVSRLVHETKGQDLLITALAQLNSDPSGPRMTIDFIGSGPSLDFLVAMAGQLGVAQQCRFLGAQSREDVYKNLSNYDVLVQPSRIEGFGLTIAEGMAAKLAVVVSDVEGPMEIIDKGKFGHFFRSNDAGSLAEVLRSVVALLPTRDGLEMLCSARQRVIDKYDLINTSQQYCSIYQEVIDG